MQGPLASGVSKAGGEPVGRTSSRCPRTRWPWQSVVPGVEVINEVHVAESGLVVVDVAADDDETAFAFQEALAAIWAETSSVMGIPVVRVLAAACSGNRGHPRRIPHSREWARVVGRRDRRGRPLSPRGVVVLRHSDVGRRVLAHWLRCVGSGRGQHRP
ncbi:MULTISPECIES: DUF6207 family protein [unclassified Streptomyces]|uniref:DUF6207 family protein n=1 Tax=unclassified Streptomyces TaxID=2593676 RepID=UPI002E32ED71|nr:MULTISPECIES: DUF6207 family protein [unclassified Streptomyces]